MITGHRDGWPIVQWSVRGTNFGFDKKDIEMSWFAAINVYYISDYTWSKCKLKRLTKSDGEKQFLYSRKKEPKIM